MLCRLQSLTGLLLLLLANPARGAEPAHPVVPAFERLHSAGQEPELGGALLWGELSCTACHQVDELPLTYFHHKPGPVLDVVGSRVRPEYLQAFLADPQGVKPGTTMPDPFASWSAADKSEAVEALTHFLASTGGVNEQRIHPQAIAQGDALFHRIGCVACHDPQQAGASSLATSVPLGNLGAKYTVTSLAAFLQDPSHARPAARMPSMNMNQDEARQVAAFLLRDLKDIHVPANLKYALYSGDYSTLPDFSQLKPQSTGETYGFDLSFVPEKNSFALRFTGQLDIPRDGDYRFQIGSDDGSRFYVDDRLVIDNDGIHAKTVKEGTVKLTAGRHSVVVEYFEQAGEEQLEVFVEGPGSARQPLENLLVVNKVPDAQEKPPFVVQPALAEKGKELFASVGCAACHQMKQGDRPIASKLVAPTLASLNTKGGCLSAKPTRGAPGYGLTAAQRQALVAGISSLQKPLPPLTPQQQITRTIKALNCVACHQRGEIGGVEDARNPHFQTTQKEMGDEGRIPPPLTGVGGKLKPQYLQQQLELATKERPYMHTRMPRFAGFSFQPLVEALTKADPLPKLKTVEHDFPDRQFKQGGYNLVGSQGFACIKCHTWGGTQATGIQSINMQRMTTRLNQAWFEAYLLDPQQFRLGTRMQAAWPEGQVLLPKVLDGRSDTQIRAVWAYLTDGDNARIPLGLGRDPIELVATTEPIMYRNFIEGAGARGIGVAYPEKLNLAYDANNLRLAMLWQGPFIDASKHWIDRGVGFQGPLGDNVLHLAAGAPLAILSDESQPWPQQSAKELGYQFKGYRFDSQRRPAFMFRFGDINVRDEFAPSVVKDKGVFRRTLTFTSESPVEHVYFRAAVDDTITAAEGGVYVMKEGWQLKLTTDATPLLRKVAGKTELLAPIKFDKGKATLVQEFIW